MHIMNLSVGDGRRRPYAGIPEGETEARRGAGRGPALIRQCGTEPRQDGAPPQSHRPTCSLRPRNGLGSRGVFLRGQELGPARPRLRRPGWGIRSGSGEGLPPENSLSQLPWQRSPRRLRETPDPSSPVRVPECPPRPTWSPKKAECSRLSSANSPMEPRPPRTSPRPALSCWGAGGRASLRLRGGTAGRARAAGRGADSCGGAAARGCGLHESGGRESRGTEDSGGRREEGNLREQTGVRGGGRAGRGPEENGDLGGKDGGGATLWPHSAAGLDRPPAPRSIHSSLSKHLLPVSSLRGSEMGAGHGWDLLAHTTRTDIHPRPLTNTY